MTLGTTGTGYKPTITVKKSRFALTVGAFNGVVAFLRGFKPEWLWPPEEDANMLLAINTALAGVGGLWVSFWDIKQAWYDKRRKGKWPG